MKVPCGKIIKEFGAGDRDCGAYCPFCKRIQNRSILTQASYEVYCPGFSTPFHGIKI